eukprot:maker-scaffold783_size97670-snap-gene-0.22 protein:Tk08991 transcript:maker-scaffold783_size97670-snap-gene-0.22-mRNA-1 annotation:"hypothetical protein DAPPUDRAFT_314297"
MGNKLLEDGGIPQNPARTDTNGSMKHAWCLIVLCIVPLVIQAKELHEKTNTALHDAQALHEPAQGHGADANVTHESHAHGVVLASWRWNEYSSIMMFTLMILLAGILKLLFHHIPFLAERFPESCVLIVIGIIIGGFIYNVIESQSHHFPYFTSFLFFNVLLPPIILDSAYSLYDRSFLSNLGSVVLFAVVGTLFNVFAIGYMLYFLGMVGAMGSFSTPLTPISCLVFSSLIAAVDPVAVLAIFDEIGVNLGLYFLVFGESLFNDGVTVVLYNTMVALQAQDTIDPIQYVLAFLSFFTVVFGGLAIGILIGALSAYILKFTQHTRVIEPLIVFVTSYLAFILAETIHWSGILSLIGCGIIQKRYAFPNMSKKSYTTVKYSVKTLASFSDCIIFLFLGIVTFSHELEWHTGFVIWTVVLCTAIRFIGVFSLSALINQRRMKKISSKEQFIMAYGGLRGAVGFSLVTILDDNDPLKNIFLTTTLAMIFVTVFIQGGTIKFLVSKLKIAKNSKGTKMISTDVNLRTIDHVMAGVESVLGKHSGHSILEAVRTFDQNYTKKLLVRKDAEDIMALRFERITLDEHCARLYGPTVMVHNHTKERPEGSLNPGSMSEVEEKKLRLMMKNTPFERYRNKAYLKDSPEHFYQQLGHEQKHRGHMLETHLSLGPLTDEPGEEVVPLFKSKSVGSSYKRNKDRWQTGVSGAKVLKQYQEAKEQFKQSESNTNQDKETTL